jgi:hypothetical protein
MMKNLTKTFVIVSVAVLVSMSLLAAAPSFGRERRKQSFSCLTEEQRNAVQAKMKEMRAKGADPKEIHNAVKGILEGYGVDLSDHFGHRGPDRAALSGLSEEQRNAVRAKMREMRDAGADPETIHSEVGKMFEAYGVQPPEPWQGRGVFSQLTEEQKDAVRTKTREMRDAGAGREEIHAEVTRMLKGYGVELPERPTGRPNERALFTQLTAEQREAVHQKIRDMRDSGASREEIRAALSEMLKDYGVELPSGSGPMSGTRRRAAQRIEAQSHPNPAHSEVDISYVVPARSNVQVRIYNTAGQVVRAFDMREQEPGSHNIHWDGRRDDGKTASSGMYLYRIDAGDEAVTNCLVLLN